MTGHVLVHMLDITKCSPEFGQHNAGWALRQPEYVCRGLWLSYCSLWLPRALLESSDSLAVPGTLLRHYPTRHSTSAAIMASSANLLQGAPWEAYFVTPRGVSERHLARPRDQRETTITKRPPQWLSDLACIDDSNGVMRSQLLGTERPEIQLRDRRTATKTLQQLVTN